MATAHITPRLFAFYRDLAKHNDREWFNKHKDRYEGDVREPLQRFISDASSGLRKVSPHLRADPRPVGGSLMRIHRDTRFSKDKTPYKTMAGIHFRHEAGKDIHAPGLYLHLATDEVFAAAGLWQPETAVLGRIRDQLVAEPARWKKIVGAKGFRDRATLGGEQLQRAPAGYDAGHELVADLRRKSFIATTPFTQADACRADFLDRYLESCRAVAPFMKFLADALAIAW